MKFSLSRLKISSRETDSGVPSRVSQLISKLRLNLVLTYGIPSEFVKPFVMKYFQGVALVMYARRRLLRGTMVITYSKSIDQPLKVLNPARSQLNRENEYFPVPVRA